MKSESAALTISSECGRKVQILYDFTCNTHEIRLIDYVWLPSQLHVWLLKFIKPSIDITSIIFAIFVIILAMDDTNGKRAMTLSFELRIFLIPIYYYTTPSNIPNPNRWKIVFSCKLQEKRNFLCSSDCPKWRFPHSWLESIKIQI